MSAKWGERSPQVAIPDEGPASWIADGQRWGFWSGKKVEMNGPKPIRTAYDRGGVEDVSELRAGNPVLRLKDMDRDQVWAHVVYGPVTSIRSDDPSSPPLRTPPTTTGFMRISAPLRPSG